MFRLPFKVGFTISDKSKIEKYDINLDWMITQEEIEIVHGNGTHVAILGAGATLATTDRNPEKNDKQLPLMNNIVEVVGLEDIVDKLPDDIQNIPMSLKNFIVSCMI